MTEDVFVIFVGDLLREWLVSTGVELDRPSDREELEEDVEEEEGGNTADTFDLVSRLLVSVACGRLGLRSIDFALRVLLGTAFGGLDFGLTVKVSTGSLDMYGVNGESVRED